jgi:signal transduction histidine kinase
MRNTLTGRAIVVTCLVALASVIATAAAALPLAVNTANRETRDSLNNEVTVAARLLSRRPNPGADGAGASAGATEEAVTRGLEARGITVIIIRGGQPDRPGVPTRLVKQLIANVPIRAQRATVDGHTELVAGRPLPGNGGILLTVAPVTGTARKVWNRLWLALLAGLTAGLAAGTLLAARLSRPFREAAHAAARLSAGDRTVRLDPAGPTEAAELAHAFNDLAAALHTSEGREREFLLSVSHELRTPLTTIKGYAEALADGVIAPDGVRRTGQTMLDEASRLDRLIADLLVLARLEAADLPLEVVSVDLGQLVRDTAQAWSTRCAAAGVVVRVDVPTYPLPVETDPGRIRQVIDGLLENALRVLPPGTPLVLTARPSAGSAAPGGPVSPGGVVEVRDGGPGFTDDDLAVAFERGALSRRYQGERTVGSGLGLALAARLVGRLGGVIEAGHAIEGGARFTVTLPYLARTLR